ncbi:MAG: tetratricopeptide repeat protein [Planctomycetes bacterium]|nr:tetratricopeptide repeat protein [Planctomycetota bacterium]
MPRCNQGHEWQAADEESAACPFCGMPDEDDQSGGAATADDVPADDVPADDVANDDVPMNVYVDSSQEATVRFGPAGHVFVGGMSGGGDATHEEPPADLQTTAADALPAIPGYDVIFELGRGGMGVVYEAWQIGLQRRVAIKMILANRQPRAEDYKRFRHEAAVVARLQHPNIVQIFDIGEHDGLPFFALELVEGGSLSQRLAGQPLPPTDAARLAQVLAKAVQAAHDRGVVHRDLKPGNILLAPTDHRKMAVDGTSATPGSSSSVQQASIIEQYSPKIADFGLAKLMIGDQDRTQTGVVMGTPSYMAPEQASGKPEAVGPLADLYALGAILYEMLTGRPPFSAPTAVETVVQVVALDAVPPRRLQPLVPRDLETICLKCLRKQPQDRYASAREMADDLGRFLAGQPIEARPVGRLERGVRWCRRNPLTAGLAGLVTVAVLALIVGAWLWSVDRAERRATTTQRVEDLIRAASAKQREARSSADPAAWAEALAFLNQADGLLEAGLATPELHERVQALREVLTREQADAARTATEAERDRRLLQRLDTLRIDAATLEGQRITFHESFAKLCEAFRDYGIDLFELQRAEAAKRIRGKPIRGPLCEHLLHLSAYAPTPEQRDRILDVLRLVEAQPERDQLIVDLIAADANALKNWARSEKLARFSSGLLLTLGMTLEMCREPALALEVLRKLQDRFPGDFWANYNLGVLLTQRAPPRWGEAAGCFRAALALRPENAAVLNNLGIVLAQQGRIDESIDMLRRAVKLRPDLAHMRYNLGVSLLAKGEFTSAAREFQGAIAVKKNYPHAYAEWGKALLGSGQLQEAIVKAKQALALADDAWLRDDVNKLLEQCRRLLPLTSKLEQVVRGELQAASGVEQLGYAELCYYAKRHAAAARLAAAALAANPELAGNRRGAWHRYNAACYAALAAAGEGTDAASLSETDRSRLRLQAIDWLRADLDEWQKQWRTGTAQERLAVGKALKAWLTDHALASLRDPVARDRLPQAERDALSRLWNAADGLLHETRK